MNPITTLMDIRFTIERSVQDSNIENELVINWCNDAQTELITFIEVPDTASINITTDRLDYPEPANIKRVNRMWLQGERDLGVDRDIPYPYRRYNGLIVFETFPPQEDVLNVDFYKHLKYFEDVSDTIDLDDRFTPLYTSYGQAQYYDLPGSVTRLGEAQARKRYEQHYARHLTIKDSIASFYASQSQTGSFKAVW